MNGDPRDGDTLLSAVVAVRRPGTPMPAAPTSADLDRMLPDPHRIADAAAHFSTLGFETSPPVAGSFSITAPRRRFVDVFEAVDAARFSDTWLATRPDTDLELPLERLHDVLGQFGDDIYAIFFTPAPDFGPGNP